MKTMIFQILISCLLVSCSNINRNGPVDNKDLTGKDYRLFQNTPAWEFAKSVQDEDEKRINEILDKDQKLIDYQEPKYGNTLLMLTIMNQQMKPFKILLEHKADVSIHNRYDGTSALIEASGSKYYKLDYVKILLDKGANPNDVQTGERRKGNSTRFTPLMAASQSGRLDIVKLLVSNGADINYKNEFNQTAFTKSIMTEHYNVSFYLLQKGADYKQPIFYRPGNSADYNPAEDKPIYLVDVLREDFFELDTDEYKYKIQIVDFLKSKGIDYRATPIPEYIKKKAQEAYPNNWKEYLEKY
jgi:uncharacterized protein